MLAPFGVSRYRIRSWPGLHLCDPPYGHPRVELLAFGQDRITALTHDEPPIHAAPLPSAARTSESLSLNPIRRFPTVPWT